MICTTLVATDKLLFSDNAAKTFDFKKIVHQLQVFSCLDRKGVTIVGGLGKILKLNSRGAAINKRAGKMSQKHSSLHNCQHTETVSIIFSLNTIIIGTTFSYVVSAIDDNFSLFMRSSSNENSNSRLGDAILDRN